MIELTDFPKIMCPFVRKLYKVNEEDWRTHGARLQLRQPAVYLVTPEVVPGFEWVFDRYTIAVEKLNGTNVKLLTKNGRLIAAANRKNQIDMLNILTSKGRTAIVEGIFSSVALGYVEDNLEQSGELIGKNIQGNPYEMNGHLWYPFAKAYEDLSYRSFHEHEKTFDNWNTWFKDWLVSRFHIKRTPPDPKKPKVMAEGIVLYSPKRRIANKCFRAKLRRDMFEWYYSPYIQIYYDQEIKI
jgi:hypothetical protein